MALTVVASITPLSLNTSAPGVTIRPLGPTVVSLVQFHGWEGFLPYLQDQGDVAERIGGGPSVSQVVNTKANEADIKVTFATDVQAEAIAAAAAISALQFRICSCVDDLGRKFSRIRIGRAAVSGVLGTSGAAAYRVEATLTIEVQANPT